MSRDDSILVFKFKINGTTIYVVLHVQARENFLGPDKKTDDHILWYLSHTHTHKYTRRKKLAYFIAKKMSQQVDELGAIEYPFDDTTVVTGINLDEHGFVMNKMYIKNLKKIYPKYFNNELIQKK
jgi:hypothetical protein